MSEKQDLLFYASGHKRISCRVNIMQTCALQSLLNLHMLYREVIFIPSNLASVSAVQQSHAELHLSLEVCVTIKASDNRLQWKIEKWLNTILVYAI